MGDAVRDDERDEDPGPATRWPRATAEAAGLTALPVRNEEERGGRDEPRYIGMSSFDRLMVLTTVGASGLPDHRRTPWSGLDR